MSQILPFIFGYDSKFTGRVWEENKFQLFFWAFFCFVLFCLGDVLLYNHGGLVTKSCPTLLTPWTIYPASLLCLWDSPGKNTGEDCHFLLQGIFPTQESNPCLLHCRWIPYHLSHHRYLKPSYHRISFTKWVDSAHWSIFIQWDTKTQVMAQQSFQTLLILF